MGMQEFASLYIFVGMEQQRPEAMYAEAIAYRGGGYECRNP